MGSDQAASKLLAEFERDALFLTKDMDGEVIIRQMMLGVMKDLTQIFSAEDSKLCVGTVAEAFAPAPGDTFGGSAPPLPYQYDFLVVTDKFLVVASGYFDTATRQVLSDPTTVRSLKKITSVTRSMQPGDTRENGLIATHHDIHVTFADGSAEGIPGLEEELSPIGRKRMAELIPALYASMST